MQVFLRNKKQNIPNEMVLGISFGLLAILGTYFGKPYKGGIANLRDTSVIISGLFAGPVSGGIAGFIGGIHRYYLGGITALPCSLATMVNGLISGYFYYLKRDEIFPILPGILLTLTLETFHINLVMLLTTPRSVGIDIGKFLYGPMVLMNSLGVGIFLYMLQINLETAQKETALTAQRVLNIASKTFPILSKESKENAFQLTANLIHSNTNLDSVMFTDKTKILGIAGNLNSELSVGEKINDPIIKKAVENGKAYKYYYKKYSALTVPLKNSGGETMGSLVLYRKNKNTITDLDIKLARGMSLILSTQMELKEIEMEKTLRLMAQFNELQSKINPHFLFNSLNTISHILRSDPSKARNLIIELSTLLRKAIENKNELISFEEEIEMVKSYLKLEEARFEDKLKIIWSLEPEVYDLKVPPLILQPIVENSIKHGFDPFKKCLIVKIEAHLKHKTYIVSISDNGRGIKKERLKSLMKESGHLGISNVRDRLNTIYGSSCNFSIKSEIGKGTKTEIKIGKVGVLGGWLSKPLLSTMKLHQEKK